MIVILPVYNLIIVSLKVGIPKELNYQNKHKSSFKIFFLSLLIYSKYCLNYE